MISDDGLCCFSIFVCVGLMYRDQELLVLIVLDEYDDVMNDLIDYIDDMVI